jgi:hypothetical protein
VVARGGGLACKERHTAWRNTDEEIAGRQREMPLHGHRNFEQRDAGSNIPEIKPVRVDGDPVRERSGQRNVINGRKQGGAALSRAFHFLRRDGRQDPQACKEKAVIACQSNAFLRTGMILIYLRV